METTATGVFAQTPPIFGTQPATQSTKLPPPFSERRLRHATQKCKCCGVERPFADFREDKRSKTGRALTCKTCETQKRKNALAKAGNSVTTDNKQRSLESYTAVELMLELRRRGYDGELIITERKTVRLRDL